MVEKLNPAEQLAASGTPSATTFLRGDNSWNAPAPGVTVTNSSSLPITLTSASTSIQVFTGVTAGTLTLPTTSVLKGSQWLVLNQSSALLTVVASDATSVVALAAGTSACFTADIATPVTNTDWASQYGGALVNSGKVFSVGASLSLTGSDNTLMTFPTTSATIARTDAANTFTGVQTMTSPALTTPAISGTATGSGVSATPTASILAMWDANKNLSCANIIEGFTSTVTSATPYVMTMATNQILVFTGSTAQTVTLPTTSVPAGADWMIINQASTAVTVQSSGANTVCVLAGAAAAPYTWGIFTAVIATPTTAANWNWQYKGSLVASGKAPVFSNSITFTGTDATTMTFPTTSATIARTDAANTFTGVQTMTSAALTTPVLGTPTSGTLTNCTGLTQAGIVEAGTISAAVTSTATTQTKVASLVIAAAPALAAGNTFRVRMFGQLGTTTSSTISLWVYMGTNAATTDVLVTSATGIGVATNGTIAFDALLAVRTIATAGTVIGSCRGMGSTTIIATGTSTTGALATTTTNASTNITLAVSNAGATNTFTVNESAISWASG